MSPERVRFELPFTLADQLASTMNVSLVGQAATADGLRRELSFAARRAKRSGRIAAPLVGLRLSVYRTTLFGRPYDLVTRSRGRDERVVGIVAAAPEPARLSRVDRLSGEVGSGGAGPRPILSEAEAAGLALELLGAETEDELDQFLGKMFSSVSKAAQGVTRTVSSVGKSLGKAVDAIDKVVPIKSVYNTVSKAAKSIEKGLDAVNKLVPIGSVLSLTPLGMTMRAARSLGRVAAGENIFKVAGNFVKSGLKDVGQAVQLASTVASFVPGVGTGVAAALGAAGALAQGRPITEAVLAAARGALPGGAIAAAAFDVASGLAQGKSLSESALSAARNQLPGGAAARAAFDAGLALAQGKKLQDVAISTAGRILPPSPFSSTGLDFAQKVARGENVQKAALSTAGGALLARAQAGAAAQVNRVSRPLSREASFPANGWALAPGRPSLRLP
jgi:hypothetical protein